MKTIDIDESYTTKNVAIKALRERDNFPEFYKEVTVASQLQHDNIVEFIGVCFESNFIIMELMEGGQLLSYLRSSRSYDFTPFDLVDMSFDILKGCVFLEEQNFVHRDLAARNCLLTSTNPISRKVLNFSAFVFR